MATPLEIRERHKQSLIALLKIKRANPNIAINGLKEEIESMVGVMEQEDVAYVEKVIGIKAL